MAANLDGVRDRGDTVMVPMNGVKSGRWSSDLQYLATEGLNGCTAVAITSEHAGILAHIAPRTETANGDENVQNLMQQVINHFNQGRALKIFPPATSIVLAAIYMEGVAHPHAVSVIRRVLAKLGLSVRYEEYRVRELNQQRASGRTSLVIHGRNGTKPHIYIDDKLLEHREEPAIIAGRRGDGVVRTAHQALQPAEGSPSHSSEAAMMAALVALFGSQFGERAASRVNEQVVNLQRRHNVSRREAISQLLNAARNKLQTSTDRQPPVPSSSTGRTNSAAATPLQRSNEGATALQDVKVRFAKMRQDVESKGLGWPAPRISETSFERMAADTELLNSTLVSIRDNLKKQIERRQQDDRSSEEESSDEGSSEEE